MGIYVKDDKLIIEEKKVKNYAQTSMGTYSNITDLLKINDSIGETEPTPIITPMKF